MADISIKDLNMVYTGGTQALFDVSLNVRDGEFFVLLGPTLSGKSTVLRLIAGLDEPTGGEISVGGKPFAGVPTKDRDLALIYPNSLVHNDRNVYENLGYGLKLRKAPKEVIDLRVRTVAELFGLTDVLSKRPKQLTAVQRQRVALGRSVAREPAAFLFDEPLGGFDDALRATMLQEISRLHIRLKRTFLYATEEVSEAMLLADRIAVMKDGFVLQIGTPQELYESPANLFVADMVCLISFTRGATIETEDGKAVVRAGETKLPLGPLEERIPALAEYADTGREVVLAVRAEDVKVGEGDLEMTIDAAENGYLSLKAGALTLGAKGEGEPGSTVHVFVDPASLLLFDGETERTLFARDGEEGALLPPSPARMRELAERAKPKKGRKK